MRERARVKALHEHAARFIVGLSRFSNHGSLLILSTAGRDNNLSWEHE
jgi:hypothetical protein